jgi:hypothetical protein
MLIYCKVENGEEKPKINSIWQRVMFWIHILYVWIRIWIQPKTSVLIRIQRGFEYERIRI